MGHSSVFIFHLDPACFAGIQTTICGTTTDMCRILYTDGKVFEMWRHRGLEIKTSGLIRGMMEGCAEIRPLLRQGGGDDGHIEIKVDKDSWCSDYCTDHPRDTSRDRKVIGIYMPKGNSR